MVGRQAFLLKRFHFRRDICFFFGSIKIRTFSWICLFDAWNTFPNNILKLVVNGGDESHGIVDKDSSRNKQIQA